MINSIGNQGVPQPGPLGAPKGGGAGQTRGDERTGGLGRKNGHHQGKGFIKGHLEVNGGDHRIDNHGRLTKLDRIALRLAKDASLRYIRNHEGDGNGPTKVDKARISSQALGKLRSEGAEKGSGKVDSDSDGDEERGGATGSQPTGGGASGGGVASNRLTGGGPSGPTYTARRA